MPSYNRISAILQIPYGWVGGGTAKYGYSWEHLDIVGYENGFATQPSPSMSAAGV